MTSTLPTTQPRILSVDVFRFLAALGVIILHVEYPNVPGEIRNGLRLISRWAIPFFFITSGYFLAAKNAKTKQLNVQPAVERLLWVFLLWALVYTLVIVYQHDINTSIRRIISPYFIYFGNFVHLWFISSLIFGHLFIAFCYNFNLKGLLVVTSIVALIIALLSGAYAVFDLGVPLEFGIARHWLSIPFLYIGMLLFQKNHPPLWISVFLVIFGAGLQIFEARFLYDKFGFSPYDHEFLIGTIPFAIGMACLALSNLKFMQSSLLGEWGREYSFGIYLIHPLLALLAATLISISVPELAANAIWQIAFPLILMSLSLIILGLIHRYLSSVFNVLFGRHITSQSD